MMTPKPASTEQTDIKVIQSDFKYIKKRDGRLVPFDQNRIVMAVLSAMSVHHEGDEADARKIANAVVVDLAKNHENEPDFTPGIEHIQDLVETSLILMDFPKTAKEYIIYRNERSKVRDVKEDIPEHIKKLAIESKKYFRTPLCEFIYYRTYSRWIEEEGRRETWIETIDRFMKYMSGKLGSNLSDEEYAELREAILKQEIMPSMRLLWSAGKAVEKSNVCAYNCSFVAPRSLKDLAEIMYISMCGTGVGFSVEQQTVHALPQIKRQTDRKLPTHIVADSKEGWADAFYLGLQTWFNGEDIDFDFSQVRPEGSRLHTMGGRSSGPRPLIELLEFARRKILTRQGSRLSSLDVHDIICKTGEVVVMGGVRRSAMISLSDLNDIEMMNSKKGQFYLSEPQRSMANNSAIYNNKPNCEEFMTEWLSLAKSGSGERGVFNRGGVADQLPDRRWKVFAKDYETCGTNPCGEIILKSRQFCNLSEAVMRVEDTEESLMRKIRLATILGTFQSTLTDFPYLSKDWQKNCEEERLLGVSLTGQWDSPLSQDGNLLSRLREEALKTNEKYARRFGVNTSTCVTCVKPSGTVSQLVDASSGMHARHSKYYIRRVRISATDSLFHMLKDQKIPYFPEVGQAKGSATTYVLEFPVAAPEGAVVSEDLSALDQLNHWKKVKTNYTEHNPSVTVSVANDEWIKTANWVYDNWDITGGLSFLPRNDHVYTLAPYESITKEEYEERVGKFPKIDFSQILLYEKEDETEGAKTLACVAGLCDI